MQHSKSEQNCKNPKDETSFLSKLFFWTELKVAFKQWRKKSVKNMEVFLKEHESKRLADKLEKTWMGEETFAKNPSLRRALIHVFGKEFALFGTLYFLTHLCVVILQPYFLRKLLKYYEPNHETTLHQAYLDASILILLLLIETISTNAFSLGLLTLGMKIRIACTSLIYRRCLKLKTATFQKVKLGHIINILSNDVKRFDLVFTTLHSIWISPLKLILATCFLAMTTEYTALAGIVFLVMSLLIQIYISAKISKQRKRIASKSDHRICLVNDLITNIKTVKIDTLEEVLAKSVRTARDSEMKEVKKANLLRLINGTFKLFFVELCSYFCILAAVVKGVPLTSSYVFVLRNIYDMLKTPIVTDLPDALMQLSELRICIGRIQEFLILDYEKAPSCDNCILKSVQVFKNDIGVFLNDVSVEPGATVLRKINLKMARGDLVALTGGGRGKSLLLQVILKEVDLGKGSLEVSGTISYASQEPWIFPSSIKQNIVFGQKMDFLKYKKIIKICALEQDLVLLPNFDDTIIEERGFILSSGLKARIHLARALYRDADIYLLDAPLVNVESFMSENIFDCVRTYLKDKCVLVVTQQLHFLRKVKHIYCLKNGRLVKTKSRGTEKLEEKYVYKDLLMDQKKDTSTRRVSTAQKEQYHKSILTTYCKFGGSSTVLRLVLLFVVVQTICTITDSFVSAWVNAEEEKNNSIMFGNFLRTSVNVWIYTTLVLLLLTTAAVTVAIFLKFSGNASQKIHETIFAKVLYATMTFYNSTPCGTILNYFSKDLGVIDEGTPVAVKNATEALLTLIATAIIISVANSTMIVPTIVLFAICIFLNIVFSSNDYTKREATARSPIYTHLAATFRGISIIRASGVQNILQREFDTLQDFHTSYFYLTTTFSIAFNFWSELVRVLYVAVVTFSFFFVKSHVGNIGLAITQSMQSSIIQDVVKSWNDLSCNLVSVEQVMEYTDLQTEPKCAVTCQETWPKFGHIKFRGVCLKYSPESFLVLKNVTFTVKAGEKVGIIGRNSSGKSSLVSTIYRLFHFEGNIFIDGTDTKSVPLQILRSHILLLPYKPNFLLGTLRKNLDPFRDFTDFQLWQTLHEVGLREYISNLTLGLESEISEDNSVFTLRQKRLLCLARGLLKNIKIIIFDKCHFSVDWKSDIMLQTVINRKFKNCTVLTLSRTLKHIAAFDKVVILYDGSVLEFDRPQRLLRVLD